jgi:5-guanidino-2-oxopentanoate decarboxylase
MIADMDLGTALARTLQRGGVDTVFGIPGVHTLEYYRGFAATGLRTILARHEGGAAFMADGYARAIGRPAACCVITGPGLTNAATGIGQARSDSVPMVVLTSVTPDATLGTGRLHELPRQAAILEQVCKAAHHAQSPEAALHAAAALAAESLAGRPRPVGLQVPTDVLRGVVPEPLAVAPAPAPPPPAPTAARVADVAARLAAARRPVLIVGGGTVRAVDDVRALVARLAIPVLTTTAGIGVVPDGDPHLAGALLSRPEAHAWLAERDLVILLGTELSETDTVVPLELAGHVVRIDVDGAEPIDAGAFARALSASPTRDHSADVAALRAAATAPRSDAEREQAAIIGLLPRGARVYADMTQLAYTGCWAFTSDAPGRYLFPAGFGALGYAVPAAIGGAVADPDARTIALVGDGGLLYTSSELMTATEYDLALTVVLWDNSALGQIHDDMVASGIPPIDVEQRNPDFALLARAHGFAYTDDPGALASPPARRTLVHLRPRRGAAR